MKKKQQQKKKKKKKKKKTHTQADKIFKTTKCFTSNLRLLHTLICPDMKGVSDNRTRHYSM